MKELLRIFLFNMLSILNAFIPKKKRILVYSGNKLYDNNEAFFEYLNDKSVFDIVCIGTIHKQYQLRKGVKIVKETLLNTIYYHLTSQIVIDSFLHKVRLKPKRNQISLQLWHGSPMKKDSLLGTYSFYSYYFCSSDDFVGIFQDVFDTSYDKIKVNGYPRNDLLFEPSEGGYKTNKDVKRVIWMPTYRHGLGRDETTKDIPVLSIENSDELNDCLIENNIHLFIKPHPNQKQSFDYIVKGKSNIEIVSDDVLRNQGVSLYSFLGTMDALLTDYSSVFYDYLLLDKPIGFVIDDIEEYKKNRGLVFDDPLSMMPGQKIYNISQLKDFLSNFYCNDIYQEERHRVNNIANKYKDNKNRERLLEFINSIVN